jgi:hypothetical protein
MKKYENFCAALENMKEIYKYEEPYRKWRGNSPPFGVPGAFKQPDQ